MISSERYDKLAAGAIAGLLLPFLVALIVFLAAKGNPSLHTWFMKISDADLVTKVITLCVFPNVIIFLIFNHFDMLKASRGVLGVTIMWAAVVFGVKLLV
jgi:hypothetical protein